MANVSKISIALTAEMAEPVRAAVASGECASGSEVIREALREWKLRRRLRQDERDELLHLWREGLASGPGQSRDIDEIKRRARKRIGC
jgi:antitoxin ParD1/3/4